jgi:hypothetical protein
MKKTFFNKIPAWIIVLLLTVFISISYATFNDGEHSQNGRFTINGVIQELDSATDGTSLCFEGTTANAFETCFLFTDPTADNVVTFGDSSFSAGATNAHSAITSITVTDTTTNVVSDLLVIDHSGGDTTTGFGTGISFKLEDDTGTTTEEHASIDVVITDGTSTTEDSDVVFSAMTNGDVAEQFRLVSANSATTGDYAVHTTNSTETNGIIDVMQFKTAGVAPAGNFGMSISFWIPDDGDSTLNENASIDIFQNSATDGTEQTDFVFESMTAGTKAEILRIVANSSVSTGDRLTITSNTTDDNAIIPILRLAQANGASTATTGNGLSIEFWPEDAGGSELQGSIGVVFTDATDASEDTDMVFSLQNAGAIGEVARFTGAGTLTIASGGGFLPPAETVTNTNVILAAECGTTYYLSGDGSFLSTLPAVSTVTSGCEFAFVSKSPPTGADIHSVTTGNSHENLIYGSVVVNGAVVACVAEDVVRFDASGTVAIGDQIILKSDGAAWYLSGDGVSASSLVCTTT